MSQDRILITGASGQIGTALTRALAQLHGEGNVLATDIQKPAIPQVEISHDGYSQCATGK